MTNPTPNPQPPRDERQDELIASVVAFAAIGTVLFLGLGRLGSGQLFSIQSLDGSLERSQEGGEFGFDDSDEDSLLGGLLEGDVDEDATLRADAAPRRELEEAEPRQRRSAAEDRIFADEPVSRRVARTTPSVGVVPIPSAEDEVPVSSANTTGSGAEPPAVEEEPVAEAEAPAAEDQPPVAGLTDVPSDYWAAPFINNLLDAGIISGFGDGRFRPEQPVTRAEFAAQLAQAFTDPDAAETVPYEDVSTDFWAADSISRVSTAEFMSGYPDDIFLPGEPVSRLEVLVSLVSGLNVALPESPQALISTYTDEEQIASWAVPKIAAATEEGFAVSHPDPDTLNPEDSATRAETAAMIYQALVQQGRLEPVESEYIVEPN